MREYLNLAAGPHTITVDPARGSLRGTVCFHDPKNGVTLRCAADYSGFVQIDDDSPLGQVMVPFATLSAFVRSWEAEYYMGRIGELAEEKAALLAEVERLKGEAVTAGK